MVISHKEGCARGIASNHGDPDHLWSKFGLTMDGFRKDIKAAMGGAAAPPQATPPATAFSPYTVRVTISDLNIRKGPGTGHASAGYIKPGVYTIVEESEGKGATRWGKLKSGAGWISLDYAKRT